MKTIYIVLLFFGACLIAFGGGYLYFRFSFNDSAILENNESQIVDGPLITTTVLDVILNRIDGDLFYIMRDDSEESYRLSENVSVHDQFFNASQKDNDGKELLRTLLSDEVIDVADLNSGDNLSIIVDIEDGNEDMDIVLEIKRINIVKNEIVAPVDNQGEGDTEE